MKSRNVLSWKKKILKVKKALWKKVKKLFAKIFHAFKVTKVLLLTYSSSLTAWYQLFLQYWLVLTWFFVYPRHKRAAILNEIWRKKLDINLLNRQSLNAVSNAVSLNAVFLKKNMGKNNTWRKVGWILDYKNMSGIKRNRKQCFLSGPNNLGIFI